MRKFTLLVVLVAFGLTTFAQNAFNRNAKFGEMDYTANPFSKIEKSREGTDTVYWSENFNGEEWHNSINSDTLCVKGSLPAGVTVHDGTGNSYYWHWAKNEAFRGYILSDDDGSTGWWKKFNYTFGFEKWVAAFDEDGKVIVEDNKYVADPEKLAERKGGYMILESDLFNTTPEGTAPDPNISMDSYVQFGPIDLSGAKYTLFKFTHTFLWCCYTTDLLDVMISNDYNPDTEEGTWTTFDGRGTTQIVKWNNVYNQEVTYPVSQIVDEQSNVYVRFHSKGQWRYIWAIDELRFEKAPDKDIRLEASMVDYDVYEEEYNNPNYDEDIPYRFQFQGGYAQIPNWAVDTFQRFRALVANYGADTYDLTLRADVYLNGEKIETFNSDALTVKSGGSDTLHIIEPGFIPEQKGEYVIKYSIDGVNASKGGEKEVLLENKYKYVFYVTDNTLSRSYHYDDSSVFDQSGVHKYAIGGNAGEAVGNILSYDGVKDDVFSIKGVRIALPCESDYDQEYAPDVATLTAYGNEDFIIQARLLKNPGENPNEEKYHFNDQENTNTNVLTRSEEVTLTMDDLGTYIDLDFDEADGLDSFEPGNYAVAIYVIEGQGDGTNWDIANAPNDPAQPFNSGSFVYFNAPEYVGFMNATGTHWVMELYSGDETNLGGNGSISTKKDKVAKAADFRVYPNPTNGELKVVGENIVRVEVANILGQNVMTVENGFESIDLSNVNNGIYMVTVVDADNNVSTKKIVKK
jgi:hypothetical protein